MKYLKLDFEDLVLVEQLSIFLGFFNKKPHTTLYYSELLLTTKQKNDYEKAIDKLIEVLKERKQNA